MPVITFLVMMLAPSALLYALFHVPDAWRLVCRLVERWRPAPVRPVGPPIERLAADLHRISARLDELVAAGPIPGRIMRVQATTAAYDQQLLLACAALEVTPPVGQSRLTTQQRLHVEASLYAAGLRW